MRPMVVGVDRPEWLRFAGATPFPERAPRAFGVYLKAVRATSRFHLEGLESAERALAGRSAIVAILHSESLLHLACPYNRATAVLVRDHGSNGLYARLARVFGYGMVDAGTWTSMRSVCAALAQPQRILVVAVDGPAGPSGVAKSGVVKLARLSGASLVPVRCSASRAVRLAATWDGRLVPLPCSVLTVAAGAPHEVPRHATRQEVAVAAQDLGKVLADLGGRPELNR